MMRSSIIFVAGVLIGTLVAVLLGSDPGSSVADPDPDRLDSRAASEVRPVTDPDGPVAPRPVVPMGGDRSLRQALEEALAGGSTGQLDRGPGRIAGVVTDAYGGGVAGVELVLRPRGAPEFLTGGGEAGAVEAFVLARRWRQANLRRTWSDADGRYAFDDLPERRWRLEARASGQLLSPRGGEITNLPHEATVDWVASPLVRLRVHLETDREVDLRKVQILVRERRGSSSISTTRTWSRSEPWLEVRPGLHHLKVQGRTGDGVDVRSSEVAVEVGEETDTQEVTIPVRALLGIDVTVVARPRAGLNWALIRALEIGDGTGGQEDLDRLREQGLTLNLRGDRREVRIQDVAPGRWLVGLERMGLIHAHGIVVVTDENAAITLSMPEPDAEHAVLIVADDPSGRPVDDLVFHVTRSQPSGHGGTVTLVIDQEPGRYWLSRPLLERGFAEGQELFLRARHPQFGLGTARGRVPLPDRMVVTWQPTAAVRVRVPGARVHLHADRLSLFVSPEMGPGQSGKRFHLLGDDDTTEFTEIATGTASIRLHGFSRSSGGTSARWVMKLGEIQVSPAPQLHERRLPGFGSIRIVFPLDGPPVRRTLMLEGDRSGPVSSMSMGIRPQEADAEGVLTVDLIPEGRYRLFDRLGGTSQTFTVQGETLVRWAPEQPNAIRVAISDPSKALGRFGFRDRDLIVSIDGQSIASFDGVEMASARILGASGKVMLGIERGGSLLNLELDVPSFRAARDNGGGFLPARR